MTADSPLSAYIGDRRPKIMAVDDEPLNLKLLENLLMGWGCEVQTATSGAEALAVVRSFAPDAILLDVRMPGQSGLEVCAALRADLKTRNVPVIFLTALKSDEDAVVGLEAGARGYVTKPIDFAELATSLGGWLRQKYADDATRARER